MTTADDLPRQNRETDRDVATLDTREVTIVIINGYNLDSPDWGFVMWGDPDTRRLGRIPWALYVAVRSQADYLLWNTGSSRRIFPGKGSLMEAQWTHEYAKKRADELRAFAPYFDATSVGPARALLNTPRANRFESKSRNTITSAYESVHVLNELIGERAAHVVSVSSRNHTRAGHHYQMVLQHGHRGTGPLKSRALRVSHECAHTGYRQDGRMENVRIEECRATDSLVRR